MKLRCIIGGADSAAALRDISSAPPRPRAAPASFSPLRELRLRLLRCMHAAAMPPADELLSPPRCAAIAEATLRCRLITPLRQPPADARRADTAAAPRSRCRAYCRTRDDSRLPRGRRRQRRRDADDIAAAALPKRAAMAAMMIRLRQPPPMPPRR